MDMFADPPPSPKDYGNPMFFPMLILPTFVINIIVTVFSFVRNIILSVLSFLNLYTTEQVKTMKQLNDTMAQATNYESWVSAAKQLDNIEGKSNWRKQKMSSFYDYPLIEHRLSAMRKHARNGDIDSMILALRAGLLRNLGGMGNPQLYAYTRFGTKQLVEEYIDEVIKQLLYICEHDFPEFPLEKKFDFFFETRQAFGRTALLLSGGATLGMYHFGVIKALWEENLLPRIISGSSVGSIVASLVAVVPDDKIESLFEPGNWRLNAFESLGPGSTRRRLYRLLSKGVLMDVTRLQECLRDNIGDVTFREAYQKSKRILNITVTSTSNFEFPRLLNYLTAPNVLIWSAACASCALRFLYEPVELMAKDKNGQIIPYHPSGLKWSDGSVASDLPMVRLSELFNVNHFLVSQVNPHVVPFVSSEDFQVTKFGLWPFIKFIAKSEIKHRVTQLAQLGLMPPMLSMLHPLITQKYVGDITIIPEITLKDYLFLISNPTPEMIQRCVVKGMKTTFPKLAIIKNHCAIEYALEHCTAILREKLIDSSATNADPHRRRSFYADNQLTTLLDSVRSTPPPRYPSFSSSSPYNRRSASGNSLTSSSSSVVSNSSSSSLSGIAPVNSSSSSSNNSLSGNGNGSPVAPPSPQEVGLPQPSSPQLPAASASPREFL